MIITKSELKILKFVYSKKHTSYKALRKKFHKQSDLRDMLESLAYHHYLVQVGGCQNNLGEPIPITDETIFEIDSLGTAEVESKQWFNMEYIISHMIIPIILAIITTLITLSLTNALSPNQQMNQELQLQQEQQIQEEIP